MNKKKSLAATRARYQAAQRIFEQSVDLAFERYSEREREAHAVYEEAGRRAKARLDRITRDCMKEKSA